MKINALQLTCDGNEHIIAQDWDITMYGTLEIFIECFSEQLSQKYKNFGTIIIVETKYGNELARFNNLETIVDININVNSVFKTK